MIETQDKQESKKWIRGTVFTHDSGYGTRYERYSMKRYLTHLVEQYHIERVLELYCDGITGIPGIAGIPLAMRGCQVTLGNVSKEVLNIAKENWKRADLSDCVQFVKSSLYCSPFNDHTFDLVWNFAVIPQIFDPEKAIQEMIRVSRRFVLIFCPNRWNYGFFLHRLYHKITKTPWDHGNLIWMKGPTLEKVFERYNLSVLERGCVDIPPFPDVDVTILAKGRFYLQEEIPEFLWDNDPQIKEDMKKYSVIETSRLPRYIKLIFTHHIYVLAEKKLSNNFEDH